MTESAANLSLMAGAAFSKKKFELAVALLDKAIEQEPQNHALHFERANSLAATNRVDDALASLQRAIELKPDWPVPHFERSKLLQRAERLGDALEVRPSSEKMPLLTRGCTELQAGA